jgi:serine/threonine protein kinase
LTVRNNAWGGVAPGEVRRLPEDQGVELARPFGLGLVAAHKRGVIHRDLKLAHVMIDGRGPVRLTDFGLATAVGTVHDLRSGTPASQAPEPRTGREGTARSDLFAPG